MDADEIDRAMDQWRAERPDLDPSPMAFFARLAQATTRSAGVIADTLEAYDLTVGEFDVLATLRRSGPPFRLSPGALARSALLSPAAMTNRLDRLEAAGLVERTLSTSDRRSFEVSLTDDGRARVDAAVTDHVANEAALLEVLGARERATVEAALQKVARAAEARRAI
jgi:DNA-binding MarR family transcriptional regulator